MDDIKRPEKPVDKDETAVKTHRKRRIRLPKISAKTSKRLLILAAVIAVLIGVYTLGVENGEKRAKKSRTSSTGSAEKKTTEPTSNRWTSVGTVQEISDTSVTVKDSRGEVKKATITKDTSIVDRKGTKLAAKDIKKDQRVIVSGTKDSKNNLTVTRIRLQQ